MRIPLKKNMFLGLLIVSSLGCSQLYKAGNLVDLGYPIETPLSFAIIKRYIDTLITKYGYDVPAKWEDQRKLIDIDSINNKRLYFKHSPEEMYLISFNGMLILADVYNEQIKKYDWVAVRDSMPLIEEKRVKARFKKEILDVIEAMAKRDGVPDSLLYYKPI